MIDIRLIRETRDVVRERLALRDPSLAEAVDALIACDADRRSVETRLQRLQADRNRLSKDIGRLRADKQDSSALEAEVRSHSTEMERLAAEGELLAQRQKEMLLGIPNLPHEGIPRGTGPEQNPVVRVHGEPPVMAAPRDHLALGADLGLFDFERATKISGSGFVCLTGAGARLERALANFLLDLHTREGGYVEIAPPLLVRSEALLGTSQLPKFEDQQYRTERDDLYLLPTAEVPVTNLHREEILSHLPLRYAAFTPCFRREAGASGLGTRGLIRMHQFDKVELVKICRPEESAAELESLTADAERVLQRLGLHYRVVELCSGDLGFGACRTYDLEVWAPGQGSYLEVSSCSNFGDFQARRMNMRFKESPESKPVFCHTLNGSGTALARLFVAIIETGQQPDGSVHLPEPLHPYFGGTTISPMPNKPHPCQAAATTP